MAAHQFNAAVPTPTTCLPSPFSLHFIFHAELLFWRSLVVARREGKVFVTGVDGHFNPIAALFPHRIEERENTIYSMLSVPCAMIILLSKISRYTFSSSFDTLSRCALQRLDHEQAKYSYDMNRTKCCLQYLEMGIPTF